MKKFAVPSVNVEPDLLDWVRQILALDTVEGFFSAYHYNLIILGKKGLAYEETERVYEEFYEKRRYLDREVFYSKLSEWKRKNREQLN